jgi:NAD(P)-dependent dehydrogenase (short-subunit alcohol dehydrogenase family)
MPGKLEGKVAGITGSNSSLGRATAGRFAALRSFARSWSVDLKGRNIRVNVVSPGTVVTPGSKNELGLSDDQIGRREAQAAAATPPGRAGMPDEIARAVVFLASDDSSDITGVELFVDGGAAQIGMLTIGNPDEGDLR